jgi:hypothetical protein
LAVFAAAPSLFGVVFLTSSMVATVVVWSVASFFTGVALRATLYSKRVTGWARRTAAPDATPAN